MLHSERALAIPGLADAAPGLGRVSRLAYDFHTGRLFLMDQQLRKVVEVDSAGHVLTTFGGAPGGGPAEIRRLVDFTLDQSHVVLLDAGNGKVLVYTRSGDLVRTSPVQPHYSGVAYFGADRLALLPGTQEAALGLFGLDGASLGGLGRHEDLPDACRGQRCDVRRATCLGCQITTLGDGGILIANVEQALLAYIPIGGGSLRLIDFWDHEMLREWRARDEPMTRAMRKDAGPNTDVFKSYSTHVSEGPGNMAVLSVVPSGEECCCPRDSVSSGIPVEAPDPRAIGPTRRCGGRVGGRVSRPCPETNVRLYTDHPHGARRRTLVVRARCRLGATAAHHGATPCV